jgi:hypothetical protein
MKVHMSTINVRYIKILTEKSIKSEKCLFLFLSCVIESVILHCFLIYKHAAEENEGKHKEPEGWHCEIGKEDLSYKGH